ncbi:MAG TPA: efflux RND transporter periplasmic adaptor subunit [Luteimonas sp.]|nr:efflux RND transporter periplasmic adaptor subunit [Luteimonas sp.]
MPTRAAAHVGYIVVLALLLAACGNDDSAAKGRDEAPVTVTTVQLQPVRWSDELTTLGTANARESVTISASVSEIVRRVHFDSGEFIKRGQPLVTLSENEQRAGVAEAQASLRDEQQLYDRNAKLADQQLIARVSIASQRAALDAAQARVAAMRAQLSDRVILAPFDGVLGLRQVSSGSLVTPGTAIATLDDVSLIKLDFTFPESALSQLAIGQRVNARSEAWPDDVFEGQVVTLGSRIDPGSRAITARAEIPNPEGKLRPGMLLDVGVERAARNAIAIPELALQQSGSQASVFRVGADGKVSQVPVTIGVRRRGQVEIVSGLKAGDRIVVEGTVKLRDGISVVEAKSAVAVQREQPSAEHPSAVPPVPGNGN